MYGKTALTGDSNDEPIMGTIETINGATITPSKSSQTISCAGKKILSNIIISPIPSGFINISGGSYLMTSGGLGSFVNRGVTNTAPKCRVSNTVLVKYTYATVFANATPYHWYSYELPDLTSRGYYFGGYYTGDSMAFKGSIDLTPFSKLQVSVDMTAVSGMDFMISVLNLSKTVAVRYCQGYLSYVSGEGSTNRSEVWDIPLSGVNGHHYICMYGYHGNGIGGTTVKYMRLL